MIDIHCHILPDLDDGSADMDESLAMAQTAVTSGVREIVTTPHFRGDEQGLTRLPKILSRYRHFSRALARTDIPIRIHPGAEILCLPQTPRLARQRELPTLADTNYLLVEFLFEETAEYMDGILRQIHDCGYRLVIAHPERYSAVQRNPAVADRWCRLGYALQLNKGSLLGAFGDRVQCTATALLEDGVIRLIASDAHSIARRTTDMRPLRQWLSRECPAETAAILLEENPRRLLNGEDLLPTGPVRLSL
jgi:protein-tyrosine phosphatase